MWIIVRFYERLGEPYGDSFKLAPLNLTNAIVRFSQAIPTPAMASLHPNTLGSNQSNRSSPVQFDSSIGQKRKATRALSGIHPGYGLRGLFISGPAAFR